MGRLLPIRATQCAGQIRCKRLAKSNANEWASAMQIGGQVECNYHELVGLSPPRPAPRKGEYAPWGPYCLKALRPNLIAAGFEESPARK